MSQKNNLILLLFIIKCIITIVYFGTVVVEEIMLVHRVVQLGTVSVVLKKKKDGDTDF